MNQQLHRLHKVKSHRNEQKVNEALSILQDYAKRQENLMPAILEAVSRLATLGEIIDIIKNVFGEYKDLSSI